jgi:hypothetical protein
MELDALICYCNELPNNSSASLIMHIYKYVQLCLVLIHYVMFIRIRLLQYSFTLVSCMAYSSTLKMEATCSSKMSVDSNGLHGVIT